MASVLSIAVGLGVAALIVWFGVSLVNRRLQARRDAVSSILMPRGFVPEEFDKETVEPWVRHRDAPSRPLSRKVAESLCLQWRGQVSGRPAVLLSYAYSAGDAGTQHLAVLAVHLGRALPDLAVRPESAASRVTGSLSGADLDFEYEEFNRAFVVTCSDRRFASAVLTPAVMEYLVTRPNADFAVVGSDLLVMYDDAMTPSAAEHLLSLTEGLLEGVPPAALTGDSAGADPSTHPQKD